ncbi:MAG TPA: bifunctional [glutamate--ammonia ligase]-adenylyl-L-tyrosine phosphorylase/[glutamate--ammonia-ligase] adenylyltransferase [Pseudomonadales bacterium]
MSGLPADLEAAGQRAVASFDTVPAERVADAVRVFALSDFAVGTAHRQQRWFLEALTSHAFDAPFDLPTLRAECERTLADVRDMPALQQGLRQIRQRFQLWSVWRHCLGVAALEETTAACSLLADELIDTALARLYGWLCRLRGTPIGDDSGAEQRLVVLALGKLGAGELNLSSDVDLVFCFAEQGRTRQHTSADGKTVGGETNQQFFVRLGQQLIQALDTVTTDGFVFRVDMRLRPYGASGPLAMDFPGMEDYYVTQGRDWERYALMKARPCAGDRDAGRALLEDLAPFVYRRYLDFGAIDALRDMKARLVADRQHPEDVKLGPGGIRDVEFSVQMQQMIWGGREPALRSTKLLEVLRTLPDFGLLSEAQAGVLEAGYRCLRDTEHSLQAEADRQTQRLPEGALARARLAACMGHDAYDAFLATLNGHRARIAAVFDELLGPPPEEASIGSGVWNAPQDIERLRGVGFRQPEAASEALSGLVAARDRSAVSADARTRLDALMPGMIEDLLETADPDLALNRVTPILRAVLRRSAYLALLKENPRARRYFVELVSTSLWLANCLADHPAFFDSLLGERLLTSAPGREALAAALREALAEHADDIESCLEVLREFKSHHVFNVALAELRGTLPLMKVSDALTWLAEAVLGEALTLAWNDNLERFPEHAEQRPFLIIGYGKLGGIELGPGSDLDLVFLHDLPDSAGQFLHRLVRRLLHVLTAPTYNGTLSEIDTRLRPSGNAGTMVSSLAAFEEYQRKQAWVWEHQALVRARPVAGDPVLASRFMEIRRSLLGQPRDRVELAEAVRDMRSRMRGQLPADEEAFDLKRGTGGIVDIEFVVQYLVLAHAHDHPALSEFTDNVRILDAVDAAELLPAGAAARLTEAYLALRAEWHRSVLDIPDTARAAQTLSRYRDDVKAIWKSVFEDGELV